MVAANALPEADTGGRHGNKHCVTHSEAATLVTQLQSLYNVADPALADEILTDDFHEYSDSLNWLLFNASFPPRAPIHTSKADFLAFWQAVQGAGGNEQPFETLNIWLGCHTITFRWLQQGPVAALVGIDVLELRPRDHKIQADYSEFNTLPALVNGGCTFNCPAPA